ncbi:MAG: PKD domain-containing protein [Reichenbachiella sp.]
MKRVLHSRVAWLFAILTVLSFSACDEDDVPVEVEDPIASFQYAIGDPEWAEVSFTNFSQNAEVYGWSFGDGGVSVEEHPVYTYTTPGDYTVTLVATNAAGVTSTFEDSFTITDPNEALKLITGEVSKTWRLYREGVSMSLGPNADDPAAWWSGATNNGDRPCIYQQEFTFHLDGTFEFDNKGVWWAEYGLFNNIEGCDPGLAEGCYEDSEFEGQTMTNACGDDIDAFRNTTHSFEFESSTGVITLTGMGAWIGIPKLGSTGERIVPELETSFQVSVEQFTGYDVMLVEFIYDGVYWPIRYAHYTDAGLEPELVTESVVEPCSPAPAISPTELSRTFASDAAEEFVLLDTIASGSGIIYGVDDPANAAATKVGKFIRNAGVQYQELKLQTSPTVNGINFENISTVSIDVFLPNSNDYDGALNDKVIVGLGATTCPPNWWEDNLEFSTEGVAKDQWVTLTYDITAPSFVAVPDNGATPKDRNDFDMVYINIGGGGHDVGAEFYIRNLKFN